MSQDGWIFLITTLIGLSSVGWYVLNWALLLLKLWTSNPYVSRVAIYTFNWSIEDLQRNSSLPVSFRTSLQRSMNSNTPLTKIGGGGLISSSDVTSFDVAARGVATNTPSSIWDRTPKRPVVKNSGFSDFLFFGSVGDFVIELEDVETFHSFRLKFFFFLISQLLFESFIELVPDVNEILLPFLLLISLTGVILDNIFDRRHLVDNGNGL